MSEDNGELFEQITQVPAKPDKPIKDPYAKHRLKPQMTAAKARELLRDRNQKNAIEVSGLDKEQAENYRKTMNNRAVVDGYLMMETIIDIAQDRSLPGQVRLNAAALVLERALGKPAQEIKIEDGSKLKYLSTAELVELASKLGVSIGGASKRVGSPTSDAETGAVPALPEATGVPQLTRS